VPTSTEAPLTCAWSWTSCAPGSSLHSNSTSPMSWPVLKSRASNERFLTSLLVSEPVLMFAPVSEPFLTFLPLMDR
jgi:hypothetical protein